MSLIIFAADRCRRVLSEFYLKSLQMRHIRYDQDMADHKINIQNDFSPGSQVIKPFVFYSHNNHYPVINFVHCTGQGVDLQYQPLTAPIARPLVMCLFRMR